MRKRRRVSGGNRARPGAERKAGSAVAGQPLITIRAHNGRRLIEADVARTASLVRLAEEWAYIIRSRTRWIDKPAVRLSLRARALNDLERAGVTRTFMRQLAAVSHVEVELHKWDASDPEADQIHEAAAEMPWEYLISAGTRGEGRYQSILITRLFRNNSPAIIQAPPQNVLFIESAPGRFRDEYDFDSEYARISAAVGAESKHARGDVRAPGRNMTRSETQEITVLRRRIRTTPWDVVHVTGVDTHEAAWCIDGFYDAYVQKPAIWNKIADASGRIRDGMILRETNVADLPVNYEQLSDVLVNPAYPPHLMTLNLYHSGARIARALVSQGSHAALGFLDEIDDELAEYFFQAFYWALCRPGGALAIPHAFVEAWRKMKDKGDRLHGTAIVMWMGRSVFEKFELLPRTERPTEAAPESRQTMMARLAEVPIGQLLRVDLDIDDEVNYSLLHNDRPLFNKLTLTKLVEEPLEDIRVEVELNLGTQNYPFRYTHMVLDEAQLPVAPLVRIPLTATLPRSLRERIRSTVYVKVTCGNRTACETTKRVTLIPVDEWLDDTDNNPWLPSFVLPRDPAILKIINSSRRYLVGIRDDPAAGFDGYQSVDQDAEDPTAGVDAQVRALWTALVNEYRLQYINPPPAYSDQTQRLRTPSDILESNTGTCVDLALLLASCLEYIDIYPVMVLLSGHAFVGYWRSEEAYEAFVEVQRIPAEVPAVGTPVARATEVPFVDQYGWRLTRMHYDEIMGFVTAGDLVMIEATYLTSASSFAEALEEGRANMRSRREFDSLLDIRLARSAAPPVTPLPIISD